MTLDSIHLPGQRPRAQELYEYVREAILDGRILPNQRLVEERVASAASVSRTPVREAIHKLEMDGLVEDRGDGVVVVGLSSRDLAELCEVREALEGLAARLAATGRSELDLLTLGQIVASAREAMPGHDVETLVGLSHDFHDVIWQAAGNRHLVVLLEKSRSRIERIQESTLSTLAGVQDSYADHQAMLAAINERDGNRAEQIAKEHFRRAMAVRLAKVRVTDKQTA